MSLRSLLWGFLGWLLLCCSVSFVKAAPESQPTITQTNQLPILRRESPLQRPPKREIPMKPEGSEEVDLNEKNTDPYWDRPYLLAAYALVWLVLLLYFFSMRLRQKSTDDELLRLQREIAQLQEEIREEKKK
jgi:CcmD family protein